MERGNQTGVSEFLLPGLSNLAEQRQLLFVLFLWLYLLGVLGSLLIVLAVSSDPHLHTPMYFFLTNLSLADICFLSTTVPKMLVNIQTHDKSISYAGCLAKMYFFVLFASLDHFLLTGMAYDRYKAICHPLHYTTIMSPQLCTLVVAGSWIFSSLHALTHTVLVVRLSSPGNQTSISEFLLLGLSDRGKQRQLLFMLFIWMYLLGVLGSLLIILAIRSDPHLHTPIYFFLTNLSLDDVCFLSTTVPKTLVNIQTHSKTITYTGRMAQMYFFILFGGLDHFLLTGMAYDRYVAICHPLHYTTIMGPRLCALMVAGSWIISSLHALTHTLMVLRISFCADNKIDHFFCEPIQIIKLSCTDPLINEILLCVLAVLLGLGPLTGLLFSYNQIFSTILRIPSAGGRYKAFSTCDSHLSVVSLFYGTSLCVYFSRRSTQKARKDSIASVMYSVVTPMLNPFIYSLRNKDMKGALRKFIIARLQVQWGLACHRYLATKWPPVDLEKIIKLEGHSTIPPPWQDAISRKLRVVFADRLSNVSEYKSTHKVWNSISGQDTQSLSANYGLNQYDLQCKWTTVNPVTPVIVWGCRKTQWGTSACFARRKTP
ncbi:olfactory receptor 7C2-like [Tachyglossus aculeatus]|uniref:olfactory receptor 7C2-like n=1 Tax=Tachyglossus aculeatus TaxID=9261 RepID=UPI0018F418E0|nr:olfactory receptor 7C2-like [Tachyglossus aculeatus]